MNERLHIWVYGLLYPAFLGTYIVGLVTVPRDRYQMVWGIVLAIYFMCQHGEGVIARKYVSGMQCIGDLFEIALMTCAFYLFGYIWPPESGDASDVRTLWGYGPGFWLPLIFLLPPLARMTYPRGRDRVLSPDNHFYKALSSLSVSAAIFSIFWDMPCALIGVAVVLALYVMLFLLLNDQVPKSLRRPVETA